VADLLTLGEVYRRLDGACRAAGSQAAFAARAGVTPAFVSAVLNAKKSPSRLFDDLDLEYTMRVRLHGEMAGDAAGNSVPGPTQPRERTPKMVDGLDSRDGSSCHANEPTSIPDFSDASEASQPMLDMSGVRLLLADASRQAANKAVLEHVLAFAAGGKHTSSNLRCSCHRCNILKGPKRTPEQVRERLRCLGVLPSEQLGLI